MNNMIIINPASQQGKTLALKETLEHILKKNHINYFLHISKGIDDIARKVHENMDGFENFISFGGDGTVHTLANLLAKTDKNLGCIPVGSGNDIARNMGIPLDMEEACLLLKKPNIRKIDLGLINDKFYYLAISGAGFDSVVTDLANNTSFPIKGPAKYKYAVYKTLLTYRAKKFHLKYDSLERSVDAMFIVVANMASYGGGMKITPQADPADGIFDICIIKKMSKVHFIKTFPLVFQGQHVNDPYIEIFRARKVEMDSDYNFSVFADGEFICKLPAKYEIAEKALNFIVP